MDGAVTGLRGWVSCCAKARRQGVARGMGADGMGTIRRVSAARQAAHVMGRHA